MRLLKWIMQVDGKSLRILHKFWFRPNLSDTALKASNLMSKGSNGLSNLTSSEKSFSERLANLHTSLYKVFSFAAVSTLLNNASAYTIAVLILDAFFNLFICQKY